MSNNKWITGPEILKRWNQPEVELLNAHMDGLQAYTTLTGSRIRYFRYNGMIMVGCKEAGVTDLSPYTAATAAGAKRILVDPELILFLLDEVEEYEQKHGIKPEASSNEESVTGTAEDQKQEIDTSIDYSLKERHIQAKLAENWKSSGFSRREIAKALYKREYEAGHTSIESLMKRVDRLPK